MTDIEALVARFEELRDSRNDAWSQGKNVEESWTETYGDEFEKLKILLDGLKSNGDK